MRSLIFLLIAVCLFTCNPTPSRMIGENSDIQVFKNVKSTLAQHGADTFRMELSEKMFVSGVAEQHSVDVVMTILDPDRKVVVGYDESGRGPDIFHFTTSKSGIYRLVVTPFEEQAGDYTLTLKRAEQVETDPVRRIEQLANLMIPGDGPGFSVAASRDGKMLYSKGFGHANLEYDVHNTPQTIFHIASVSKQFTAFAIAMLADQGKISLDDDIRKYLPEMNDFGSVITIRHLVHHTSGLRDQWNLLAMAGWRLDDVITREQILRVIARQRDLNFKPGEQHVYCNTGYTLMAEIVSRVTGKSFPQWTKDNIFDPLAMNNTQFYDDHQKLVPNRAYSYATADSTFKHSRLNYANVGATSLFTTVEDLLKWSDNFQSMTVGNPKVMETMESRFVLTNGDTIRYAFGQVANTYKGLKTWSHGGADAGYRTFFLRFPEQRFSVAVFSNLASFNPGSLSYAIADLYLADDFKPEPEKETPPPQPQSENKEAFDVARVKLSDFTGRFYSAELETYYEFEVLNDTLVAHHQRHDDFKCKPVKADGFQADAWWMGNIDFIRDRNGRVSGMKVSNGRVTNLAFVKEPGRETILVAR